MDGLGQVYWDPKKIKPHALDPLADIVLRRKKEDVLEDMPAKSHVIREVELPKGRALRKELDEVSESFGLMLEQAADGVEEADLHFDGIEQLAKARRGLASAKMPGAVLVLDEYAQADEPVVLFSAHKAPVEYLAAQPGWAAIHGGITPKIRDQAVADFQAGHLLGIACTISAAATGITLTRSANVVFVDEDWTPAINFQAEDRVSRIGQTRPVTITRLVADHPLDRRIAQVVRRKTQMMENTTEQLNSRTSYDRLTAAAALRDIAGLIAGTS